MEDLSVFIVIVVLVVSILQIILFFKIWQMTNDTAEINKKFGRLLKKEHSLDSVKPAKRIWESDNETDNKPEEVDVVKKEMNGGLGFMIFFAVFILIGVIILIMGIDV